jgi:hypothetical protein
MATHTITTAVNIDSLVKLGSVAGLAWTRSTTTATVTQVGHGMATGDILNVTVTSDAAAITTGLKTVTFLSANTYSFTCLNAGAASGTITAQPIHDYAINGGYLTVDQHSRYGTNQDTTTAMGDIVMSASLGGTIEFNSTLVRTIAYNTGTGNVPALGATISQGSASGILLAVYSALNAAPTASGAAMPASGYVMIRQWNSVAYTAGALTGIGATATAADRAGWLEIVGCESLTATVNRLNTFKVRGDYYDFQGVTTDGTRATTYQIPTNGSTVMYLPGVEVETAASSGIYEFYPCAGSRTALLANIATDEVRGRFCWISTGGFIPGTGRKIRIPNIFFMVCTQLAPAVNVLPNATLGTRYEFATTGGGAIDMDKASMNWYCNFAQPYSVALTNFYTLSAIVLTECASPIAWSNVGVGQEAANTQTALTMGLNFAGGTMEKCVWTRAAQATAVFITSWVDCSDFSVTNERNHSLTKAANAGAGTSTKTRVIASTWTGSTNGGGQELLIGCSDLTFTDTIYYDHPATTTTTANTMYAWSLSTAASYRIKIDGLTFGGLTLLQPYAGILNIGIAGCVGIKIRNLGTAASPLDMGGAYVDATWTRSTTTMTVTKVAHGLKVGDLIAINVTSDTAPLAVTNTTATLRAVATVPTADTFTITVTNAGQTTGQFLSYYPTMAGVLVNFVAGGAANTVAIQRCYVPHLRTGVIATQDNSVKNILLEQVWGTDWGVLLNPMLNSTLRGVQSTPSLAVQASCYGTHFADYYTTAQPANLAAVAWTRSTTTAAITSAGHGLRVGDRILVTVTSDAAAIVLGIKTIIQNITSATPANPTNVFSFACLNAGAASGTLTFQVLNGRVGIQMNEPTADTDARVDLTGGSAFTSAGQLYMPVINHQADFTFEKYIRGHSSFPIAEAVMAGGTLANYDVTYSLDNGASYKNLSYPRTGAGGSNASTNVTMTSTTGVAVNDYVFGTNIAPLARVVSITNGTTIVVSIANIGAVSGTLRFNQLPNETVSDPLVGFPLRVRIKTTTTNATAISSLLFYTNSTAAARAATYDLDTVPITITALDVLTSAPVENARVYLVAGSGGPASEGVVILNTLTDVDGQVSEPLYGFTSDQPVIGKVRKGTIGTKYKTSPLIGTITSAGLYSTVFLIPDE